MSAVPAMPLSGRPALPSGVIGLKTWIWRNNARSLVLLAGFPALISAITLVLSMAWVGLVEDAPAGTGVPMALDIFAVALPVVLIVTLLWFLVALTIQKTAILSLAGAEVQGDTEVGRRIRRLLEPLVISRGLPMPQIAVIPSTGLNAFASGWSEKDAVIGVTAGLLDRLDDDELEGVLAHELTHIINRDTRLLIISIVFVGVFALASEMGLRLLNGASRGRVRLGGSSGNRRGGQIILFVLVTIVVLWIGRIGAMFLRFAISRKREYMADAGAIELTKNGDALARALTKIQQNPEVAGVSDEVQQMFIFDPPDIWEMFSTHPEMDNRIAAIRAIG